MMSGEFGFWELLALAAAVQGGFLGAVIATHARGNRTANGFLGALVLLYSVHLLHIVFFWTRTLVAAPHFWGVPWCSKTMRTRLREVLLASAALLLFAALPIEGQERSMEQDPNLNNLVHPEGYETTPLGRFGHVERRGNGPVPMILVPGGGFGWEVFEEFMERHRADYSMYAVSLAGMGGTQAPPMPPDGTSYGEQTWTRGAVAATLDLIREEQLDDPVIVGHFMEGSQIGLRLAIDHADSIRAVVLLGGTAKMVTPQAASYTLEQTIRYMDETMAPKWFKTVTLETWNANNFPPSSYSRDESHGRELFERVSRGPLPVYIRYLVEFWSSDLTLEFDEVAAPVLALTPGFDEELLNGPATRWLGFYFVDSWNGIEGTRIEVETVPGAHIFVWHDQPERVDRAIRDFLDAQRRRSQ